MVQMIKRNHPCDCKKACEDMLMHWLTQDDEQVTDLESGLLSLMLWRRLGSERKQEN